MPTRIKTIAMTRPEEDGRRLAASLHADGYKTYLVPMLRIEGRRENLPMLVEMLARSPQAVCVTSKHALPLLAQAAKAKELRLFVVGQATADAARQAGFSNVIAAEGNVESLLALLLRDCRPVEGELLYVRGSEVAYELSRALREKGFATSELIAYDALTVGSLPPDYCQALMAGEIDEVWFYSARSARNYVRLVNEAGLSRYHYQITATVNSEEVMKSAQGLTWQHIAVTL